MSNSYSALIWMFCFLLLPCNALGQSTPVDNRGTMNDGREVRLHRVYGVRRGTPFEETRITIQGAVEKDAQTIVLGRKNVTMGDIQNPKNLNPFSRSFTTSHDLELVDYQLEELAGIKSQFGQQIAELVETTFLETGVDTLPQEKIDELRASISMLELGIESRAREVLLPHQLSTLIASRAMEKLKANGINALKSEGIAKAIKLTTKQRAEIKAEVEKLQIQIQELRENVKKDVAELKRNEDEKVKAILTNKQLEEFESWDEFASSKEKKK